MGRALVDSRSCENVILIQKTDREWVTIKFSFARADGSDDNKDDIENVQDGEQNESDQY